MADFFTGDLQSTTLGSVFEFLGMDRPAKERPCEGPLIDFKKELTPNLGEAVAAFANTYGGLIFIGVEADSQFKNRPGSVPGAALGNDPRARITNIILSTVHPRPQFDVLTLTLMAGRNAVAIVRVGEGVHPPYEVPQGATVKIPVRIEDTNRQASLREIEMLFEKRAKMNEPTEEIVERYLGVREEFYCRVVGTSDKGPRNLDTSVSRSVVVPRKRIIHRLDSRFERQFRGLVRTAFRADPHFAQAVRGEPYEEPERRSDRWHQYEFRTSGERPCHMLWRAWSDGALGFTTSFAEKNEPEPVGNLVLALLLFCNLAAEFFAGHDYFGAMVFTHQIHVRGHKFDPSFPADLEGYDYDHVDGIYFPTGTEHRGSNPTQYSEEVDWNTLKQPQEFAASIVLRELREVTGARIDFEKLLEHTMRLQQLIANKS